ncbi:MAG: hypothetical protein ACJ75B_06640 [Flavisolibacter sp.]
MVNPFNIPVYKWVVYRFSPKTGFFVKSQVQPEKFPCNALPYELKREYTQAAQIKGKAKECLTKHEYKKENNSRKILTGLQETAYGGWYSGDHLRMYKGGKLKSLMIIHFTTDNTTLNVFYFSGFFKEYEGDRLRFANGVIPLLLQKHLLK